MVRSSCPLAPHASGTQRRIALLVGIALCVVHGASHAGTTIHVPGDEPTIQAGLDAALDGDVVLVAPGTYVLTETILFPPRGIALVSDSDATQTALVTNDPAMGLLHVEGDTNLTRIIDGFTLRDASRGLSIGSEAVSGIVTLNRNRFESNGPFSCVRAQGLHLIATDNHFEGNQTYLWGALQVFGNSTISNNTFVNNDAIPFESSTLTQGGAINMGWLNDRSDLVASITDNYFEGNTCTDYGGAINRGAYPGMVTIARNTMIANEAGVCAGAVYQFSGPSGLVIEDNVMIGNISPQGSAIGLDRFDRAIVRGNTLVGNGPGGALRLEGMTNVMLERNLIAFNESTGIAFSFTVGTVLTCNDVYGNPGGDYPMAPEFGNISEDPRFCNLEAGDLTLASDSPCLPAGNPCEASIGARGKGCVDVPVESLSWSALKQRFTAR